MSKEIILKKIDNEFIGVIPHLGLMSRSASPEEVYSSLQKKSALLEEEWTKAGLQHLMKSQDPLIKIYKLEKQLKRFIVFTLIFYFAGLVGLGLVIKNSAVRIIESVEKQFKESDPASKEKALEGFKKKLHQYKPYIQEFKKVLDEEASDKNH